MLRIIDFNSAPALALTNSALNQYENGNAAICDGKTGALLFYTNGKNVWDAYNNMMQNGYGLSTNPSSAQGAYYCSPSGPS